MSNNEIRWLPVTALTVFVTLISLAQNKPPSAVEDFAELLIRKQTAAEWEATLATKRELITKELINSLNLRARQFIIQRDFQQAILICSQTQNLAEQVGDRRGLARALNNHGIVYSMQGMQISALEYFQKGLKLSESLNDKIGVVSALNNSGIAYGSMGDYLHALECLQQILVISKDLGDKLGVALALGNIGNVYQEQGLYQQALDHHQQSLALSRELDDKAGVARTLGNIGNIYTKQGNYALALEYYQKSLPMKEEIKDGAGVADLYGSIGSMYFMQDNYTQALEYYDKCLAMSWQKNQAVSARVLSHIGAVYGMQGDMEKALEHQRRSLALSEGLKDEVGVALALGHMGLMYATRGEYMKALEHYQKSLALNEAMKNRNGSALTLYNIGRVYEAQGRHVQSLEEVNRAAALSGQIGSLDTFWRARLTAGMAHRALNQTAQARQAFTEAVNTVETLRTKVAGGEQESQRFFENKLSPYLAMVDLLMTENNLAGAFSYAERAKGRVLLDVMHSGRVNITKAMTIQEQDQERKLNSQIVSLNTQIFRENQRETPDKVRVEALEKDLQKARLEYEAFETNLYAVHPELKVRRGEADILSLEGAGTLLVDAGTAALEFVVTEEKTSIIILTKSAPGSQAAVEVKVLPIVIKQKDLEKRVKQFRNQVADRDQTFAENAKALFHLLLAPARSLLRDKNTLIIIPDGPLWELPFQALQSPDGRYLLKDHAIFYAPSLTVLHEMVKLRRQRRDLTTNPTLLAVGNPMLGEQTVKRVQDATMGEKLGPLPAAQRQAEELGKLYGQQRSKVYIGTDATEDRVKTESVNYNILHLAAHGAINNRSPMYSHIVLSQMDDKGKEDGLLEAWELMKLDLKADLAVLSACETARGRVIGGEGVIGLAWALFVAGCPTTVVSQWKVNDRSTADLMVEFHRQLNVRSTSVHSRASVAQALRQAALKLFNKSQYEHPYYWAGFIVVGDGY